MRLENNANFLQPEQARGCGGKDISAYLSNTASVLTIPRICEKVPSSFSSGVKTKNLANLALNLLNNGLITEEDVRNDLRELIIIGFQRWTMLHAGHLNLFNFSIEITPDISNFNDFLYDDDFEMMEQELTPISGKHPMFFIIEPRNAALLTIGKKLQEIEDKVTGLGKTAYYWLATSGALNLEVFTPWLGSQLHAVHTWWYGNDNQEDFISEAQFIYDGDEPEDFMEISPDAFKGSFPEWVTAIENALTENELISISKIDEASLESQVARILLEIIYNKEASIPTARCTSLEPMHSGMYLYWEADDMANRLIDDWYEGINQTGGEGYVESLCLSPIPMKPENFKTWLTEMEQGLKQLKNIEQLVTLIGTRIN